MIVRRQAPSHRTHAMADAPADIHAPHLLTRGNLGERRGHGIGRWGLPIAAAADVVVLLQRLPILGFTVEAWKTAHLCLYTHNLLQKRILLLPLLLRWLSLSLACLLVRNLLTAPSLSVYTTLPTTPS
jgi:hypothetical protein